MAEMDLGPADIISRANAAREKLAAAADKSRATFVPHAEVALRVLSEIEEELADVSTDMDMLLANEPPKGGERYQEALHQLGRELDESAS